ncbi:cytochrome ubiquinol oxidase subunit I [Campylobacter ureolyticus]|uniref:Cytochrome ubiquinol oxidase subunit I n=1 Tax=Campylobacter ureolyticus TaxID=827 RepID=A0A9Q4KPY7_9BACT|nr:cytochrome ubiquinol oxidase subunit I [Campylobacter ureolyticus]MCZ6160513.1 cytochrome ubiquinol oxidase subunit I [Campylobacter ureolyticus]MCZ6164170.1 cytochrome ubiquinol oxidase subunit I [Campylobacter ureolyticus]MCZ6165706.1 cytochrome ubiquinol oxidase subunit I [Campylobacter ureolyticus]MCZ6167753.1 cytochrome ubiquinol oxidase subunit I [Campylobacter ureolyticus]MDU5325839.1 cytochrome ubiquinol oxidase subunit I [Campylobacter ureolyticus]
MEDLISTVDWSRAQFALTALYHFLFVPLTLGLSFMLAFMETLYVKTGNPEWKRITKFWLRLFAVNFAIGVATGIIMEFEFGTNWANYSWFVGDIFGAPLAIEGLFAFFLEATFFAVMFFGWDKVSKKFHLFSTWMVALGSNLSAFWILVANGWMQHPVGTAFNHETLRNEMINFAQVALSPVGISKFLHTVGGGYITSALFVLGISAYFMLKNKHFQMAKKSFIVAASFGFLSSIFVLFSGDESAYQVAQKQPMKLAAMEGLYKGEVNAGIVAMGILTPDKKPGDEKEPFIVEFQAPYLLGLMATRGINNFTPGIDDLVYGNEKFNIPSAQSKIDSGKIALNALENIKLASEKNDEKSILENRKILDENMHNFGYGYLDKPEDIVPPVGLTFYSFHVMVALGSYFIVLFLTTLYLSMANRIEKYKKLLWACVFSIPLGYVACEAGWIVAEVGRQPWAIQDLMPVGIAATNLASVNVKLSFLLFVVLFTALFIAEIKIMLKQIKIGF